MTLHLQNFLSHPIFSVCQPLLANVSLIYWQLHCAPNLTSIFHRNPSTPERNHQEEEQRQRDECQMTSPTDCRQCAAEATASRAQSWAPPLPSPFPNLHPAPTNNQADPFQPPVAGPSHAPDAPGHTPR